METVVRFMVRTSVILLAVLCTPWQLSAQGAGGTSPGSSGIVHEGFVATITMDMMILPGTGAYLEESIESAAAAGAKVLVVKLTTPGGMLPTTQEMVQHIFRSPIPVIIYVSPSGGSATSAGVFITLAGHVAAMAPGTSIGAAHPVAGDGSDIQGDMRTKAENMAIAMVKSIAEQRGRNVAWAEKSVKESASLTEREALQQGVVDLVAADLDELFRLIRGKRVKVRDQEVELADYSQLPRREFDMSLRYQATNVLANPQVAALLWLIATGGISLEIYHPGMIIPGMVGLIALILALGVTQIIPLNALGIVLLAVGGGLIALELAIPSGILGVGGVIAIVLGVLYLFDPAMAPGIAYDTTSLVVVAALMGMAMLGVSAAIAGSRRQRVRSGYDAMIGQRGKALENIAETGRVFVNGEVWRATAREGIIEQSADIEIVGIKPGLTLEVRRI